MSATRSAAAPGPVSLRQQAWRPRLRAIKMRARREFALALLLSTAAALALFGAHIWGGGRYLDDWWVGGYMRFAHKLGYASPFAYLDVYSGTRPGAIAYWLLTYKLFGFHDAWHRALSVGLASALTATFYMLLRELRFDRASAAAIALLSLALPVADAVRFWITPDVSQLCLATCVGGFVLALRGLAASGWRALALHAASLTLFAVSLLIAETMIAAIALSVLLYRARVPWRRAIERWYADAALAGAFAVFYATGTPSRRTLGAGSETYLQHAHALAANGMKLFAGTLVPFAHDWTWVLVLAGLLTLGITVGVGIMWRRRAVLPIGSEGKWLLAALLAAAFAAASYLIYVPSDAIYQPLAPGTGNRINVGALLPMSVLAFAVLRLLGGLVRHNKARLAVTVILFAVVLAGAVSRLEGDRYLWDKAASEQRAVLAGLHAALPHPPAASSLLVLDAPGVVARVQRIGTLTFDVTVPVFSTWWELDAAVKLSYRRPDLAAFPVWAFQAPEVACGVSYLYQLGLDGVRHALAYGRVYIVSASRHSAVRVDSRAQCARIIDQDLAIRYDLQA